MPGGSAERGSDVCCAQGSHVRHQAAHHAHHIRGVGTRFRLRCLQVMKKKPKKGAKPGTKPLTKLEPVPSFFSFFSPPEVPAEGTELSEDAIEELQATMEEDYEMGWVPCWQSPSFSLSCSCQRSD
jgi:Nucleosome assembly protein (NAP)